jgi:phage terminase small subunit
MGLRGPAPKPTSIRVLEGNLSRRPLPTNEPRPMVGEPDIPSHLDREARREWRRLVPILLSMRVLTVADGGVLGNLCQAYSIRTQAHVSAGLERRRFHRF